MPVAATQSLSLNESELTNKHIQSILHFFSNVRETLKSTQVMSTDNDMIW